MTTHKSVVEFLQIELRALGQLHELPWIVDHISDELKRLPLCSDDEQACTGQDLAESIVQRRRKGEPLAYIFGSWPFLDCEILVGTGVLVPRPETEELAQWVLDDQVARIRRDLPEVLDGHRTFGILDLGAGSGCLGLGVACGLLQKLPQVRVKLVGVEKSSAAFFWLRKNYEKYQSLRLSAEPFFGGWTEYRADTVFDLVLSNPPYVNLNDWNETVEASVKNFEPKSSLVPADPSASLQAEGPYLEITSRLNQWLAGDFAFELCESQRAFFKSLSPAFSCRLDNDMSGHLRFARGSFFQ